MDERYGARPALSDAPLYAGLVKELGDVPAEVERAAAQLLREADQAVDFSSLRTRVI